MAVNTHKRGYSTSEVAQVFGCSVTHIHQLIEDKKLGASITEPNKPNGRRTIRIEREHIQQYMKDNPKRFSVNEMRTWGVAPEEEKSATTGNAKPTLVNRPTGAWAHLIDDRYNPTPLIDTVTEREAKEPVKNTPMPKPLPEIKAPNAGAIVAVSQTVSPAQEGPVVYSVLVNGKVSVSGITKETAVTIVQALLNDTGTGDFTAIAILKNIPKGGAR